MSSDSVTVTMTDGQCAVFTQLDKEEALARSALDRIPSARNAAAMAIVLAGYTTDQVNGCALHIDPTAKSIVFTPNA